jgi:hypothetical protein
MIIYYPTYYLIPVIPVISIDEDEDNIRDNNGYGLRYNTKENGGYNTHRNINKDIFEEVDEEYVNESTK